MGVEATHYIIQGVKIPYISGEDQYAVYEDYMESVSPFKETFNSKEIQVIFDGMNGKYILIGYILAKGIEGKGIPLTRLKIRNKKLVAALLNDEFDSKILPEEIRVFALTHYT
jgi:hypothetical protein